MKTNHQILSEILARPDAKEVMATALCNMADAAAFGGLIAEDDLADFLTNAAPAPPPDRWCSGCGGVVISALCSCGTPHPSHDNAPDVERQEPAPLPSDG